MITYFLNLRIFIATLSNLKFDYVKLRVKVHTKFKRDSETSIKSIGKNNKIYSKYQFIEKNEQAKKIAKILKLTETRFIVTSKDTQMLPRHK